MYTKDGENYFIFDGHIHFWDASPENQRNKYGRWWIDCFYDYHRNLSPPEYVWPLSKYEKYSEEDLMHDLFEVGYVDKALFLPTYLIEFYNTGFNTIERDAILAEKYPDRFILNGAFDPRDGAAGLDQLAEMKERYNIRGVKLYTAEWRGTSRGYKLSDPICEPYFQRCVELGIKNIHVHKGPTIRPLDRDAFDVADVDHAATNFPELNFIVEHCGLPRLEDFCWIAVQEPNVYAGLAVVIPFIHTRPREFGRWLGELLYWCGPDRISFASDYALWQPKWLVERFVDFQMPEDLVPEYGELTVEVKKKILGENLARLYDVPVPEAARARSGAAS